MAVVIFSRKNARSKTMRLILRPFLKLESFGYYNGDFVNQQCQRKRFRTCYYY